MRPRLLSQLTLSDATLKTLEKRWRSNRESSIDLQLFATHFDPKMVRLMQTQLAVRRGLSCPV